ncbi:helix-turn-helix transcriptional regulator [Niallia sp. FSL W8-0951]|uniref:HTH cro/C1-type domain-containing protein n=1 Tax=Niallia circulans TaxID=1397 RepID=A0AA91Z2I7_NIACI|nr:helix-turn-helix transcriptional regulator [Niallia circulans]PAD84968.1 hypothetical protein CHH57_01985 [Niallia circulans]
MNQNDIFGKCLLEDLLRKERMTKTDLAVKTGIDKAQISKYISKDRAMSLATARIISRALNCKIDDLYEWNI